MREDLHRRGGGPGVGAALGRLAGTLVRSDNVPFLMVLGAPAGLWGGLVWGRRLRPLLLGVLGLAPLVLTPSVYAATCSLPGADPCADAGHVPHSATGRA